MTALDHPGIWTPAYERRREAVCPKCGKRRRGFFERKKDEFFRRMPVNACCCGPVPCLSPTILLVSFTTTTNYCSVANFGGSPSDVFADPSLYEATIFPLWSIALGSFQCTIFGASLGTFFRYAYLGGPFGTCSHSIIGSPPLYEQIIVGVNAFGTVPVIHQASIAPQYDNGSGLNDMATQGNYNFLNTTSNGSIGTTSTFPNQTVGYPTDRALSSGGNMTITPVCVNVTVSPTTASLSNTSNTGNITITTSPVGGAWYACVGDDGKNPYVGVNPYATAFAPKASWITITSATTGTGNSTLSYSTLRNTSGHARTGYILVNDANLTITQAA